MDNKMFNELLASVEEMDKITKGEQTPSRQFEFPEPEVKAIRKKGADTRNLMRRIDKQS